MEETNCWFACVGRWEVTGHVTQNTRRSRISPGSSVDMLAWSCVLQFTTHSSSKGLVVQWSKTLATSLIEVARWCEMHLMVDRRSLQAQSVRQTLRVSSARDVRSNRIEFTVSFLLESFWFALSTSSYLTQNYSIISLTTLLLVHIFHH